MIPSSYAKAVSEEIAKQIEREENATHATMAVSNAALAIANAIRCHADAIDRLSRAVVDSGDATVRAIEKVGIDHDGWTIPSAIMAVKSLMEYNSR